ncbi:MAG: antitoxin family protein [Gemmatimonadetes bacterium]|nr:antitoxin family protein [Gemmatimonadota bacterium]
METIKIKAMYRNGVLEPEEPLVLPEGENVTVIIESRSDISEEKKIRCFRAAAGSWKEITDKRLKEDIHKLRRLRTRPEIESWQ